MPRAKLTFKRQNNTWKYFWALVVCLWAVLFQPMSFAQHMKITWDVASMSSVAGMPLECSMQHQNPKDSSMDMSNMSMDISKHDSSLNDSKLHKDSHKDLHKDSHKDSHNHSNCCDCCSQNAVTLPPLASSGFLFTRAGFVVHTRADKVIHLVSLFHDLEARGPPDSLELIF